MIDFLILGAGIAGASAAYFLADHGTVVLLEREVAAGYHSTGRSAALYTETYGNSAIRALTVASGQFFRAPPAGFSEQSLLHPRGVMMIATAEQAAAFADAVETGLRFAPDLRIIDRNEALEFCPALRPESFDRAFLEPGAMDMDVHAIHQGFQKGARMKGGKLMTGAGTQEITRHAGAWQVETPAGRFAARVLVNAAGAWADQVAQRAGLKPVGIVPKRRTAVIAEAPPDYGIGAWPLVGDIGDTFYFKPESGRLLISPVDETPMEPCDVQPDELDIAMAVARVEAATHLTFPRLLRKWAGLRSFAPDRTLVIGPDPQERSFIWVAGQGGYGIQTAPAAGRAAAALATGQALPPDLVALGLSAGDLLPERFVLR